MDWCSRLACGITLIIPTVKLNTKKVMFYICIIRNNLLGQMCWIRTQKIKKNSIEKITTNHTIPLKKKHWWKKIKNKRTRELHTLTAHILVNWSPPVLVGFALLHLLFSMQCRSLSICSFSFGHCIVFYDLLLLITPVVSSYLSYYKYI